MVLEILGPNPLLGCVLDANRARIVLNPAITRLMCEHKERKTAVHKEDQVSLPNFIEREWQMYLC
jgi:hypothetical protein